MMKESTMTKDAPLEWVITQHCCRICYARVLVRTTFDHRKIHRCSNCGVEMEGERPSVICACGIKLNHNRDAGVRCVVNTQRTHENPAEIVAQQVDISQIRAR